MALRTTTPTTSLAARRMLPPRGATTRRLAKHRRTIRLTPPRAAPPTAFATPAAAIRKSIKRPSLSCLPVLTKYSSSRRHRIPQSAASGMSSASKAPPESAGKCTSAPPSLSHRSTRPHTRTQLRTRSSLAPTAAPPRHAGFRPRPLGSAPPTVRPHGCARRPLPAHPTPVTP